MNYIKFLGTAGARVVVMKQLRASGGIWLSLDGTHLLIDPGPGTLTRCMSSKPKLPVEKLDALILTHKHLDHSNDINIMAEAMTDGGFKRKGTILAPADCVGGEDRVIFKYIQNYVAELKIMKGGGTYRIGHLTISTPIRHIHGGAETYGLNIKGKKLLLSYIADTRFFDLLLEAYKGGELLIINVVRAKPTEELDHLSVEDVGEIISNLKPKVAILTHFGMTMLRAKPWKVAEELKEKTGVEVVAAGDGMKYELDNSPLF
jgi:phosphoribosyl 1,2-cyclic phosphodiesterase